MNPSSSARGIRVVVVLRGFTEVCDVRVWATAPSLFIILAFLVLPVWLLKILFFYTYTMYGTLLCIPYVTRITEF